MRWKIRRLAARSLNRTQHQSWLPADDKAVAAATTADDEK